MRRLILLPAFLLLACGCPTNPTETVCEDDDALCLVNEDRCEAFLSVRAVHDDDVWMVGSEMEDGSSGPSAWNWDGEGWTALALGAHAGEELWWVHPTADRVTLVGTGGTILELNRASGDLPVHSGPDAETTFFGVWGAAADDVWAVGGVVGGGALPALWHRDADGWTEVTVDGASEGELYFKVDGTAADDVWVVGEPGILMHWDGAEWTTTAAPDGLEASKFLTVAANGDGPIAVGGLGSGVIARWDGTEWLDESLPSGGINGVCASGGEAVAVGNSGSVHRFSGGVWESELVPLTFRDYHGCVLTDSGELWAVGGQITSRPLTLGVVAFEAERGMVQLP